MRSDSTREAFSAKHFGNPGTNLLYGGGKGNKLGGLAGSVAKAAYARQVRELTDELEAHLSDQLSDAVRHDRALAAVALCVGGIAVARSVGDEELSCEVLRTAREHACAALRGSRPAA